MNGLVPPLFLLFACLLFNFGSADESPDVSSNATQPSCIGNSSLPCISNKLVAAFRKINNIPAPVFVMNRDDSG